VNSSPRRRPQEFPVFSGDRSRLTVSTLVHDDAIGSYRHSEGQVGKRPVPVPCSIGSARPGGLGFDGRIMSGWASTGQIREESEKTMAGLTQSEGVAYVYD
jgi:hypothetical protein